MKHVRGLPRSSFFLGYGRHFGQLRTSVRMYVCTYVEHTRPRAMPIATMTMKTQTHGFTIFHVCTTETYGAPLCGPSGRLGAVL